MLGSGDRTATQNILQGIRCARLSETFNYDPDCRDAEIEELPNSLVLTQPGLGPVRAGPNPFATSLDQFKEQQYQDQSTTYSLPGLKANDHQHSNPFSSAQTSAERDLTGDLNSSPDPVFGD